MHTHLEFKLNNNAKLILFSCEKEFYMRTYDITILLAFDRKFNDKLADDGELRYISFILKYYLFIFLPANK